MDRDCTCRSADLPLHQSTRGSRQSFGTLRAIRCWPSARGDGRELDCRTQTRIPRVRCPPRRIRSGECHRNTPLAQSLLGTVSLLSEIGWRGTDYARRFGPGRKYAHSHARSSCFASQTRSWIVGEELTLGNSPRSRNALSGLRARYARSALILS